MESLQNIKRRAKSVKNIGQITKAMELVAATKMRRSQEIALASRPYAYAALELLANLSKMEDVKLPTLFERREVKKIAVVVVTSDKGLAGAFNAGIIKAFDKFLKQENGLMTSARFNPVYMAIGQKAAQRLERTGGLYATYTRVGDYTSVEQVQPIANQLIEGFSNKKWDRVVVFSMNFKSALSQEVVKRELFPIDIETLRQVAEEVIPKTGRYAELRERGEFKILDPNAKQDEYLIEPSAEAVLNNLARHLVTMQIYHLILEANASEHAARRLAMKNASDNADDLGSKLNLEYNKSRQAAITREIIEITSGAESLK